MKANFFRTLWVVVCSVYVTVEVCLASIYKHLRGTTNRQWVNGALQRWTSRLLNIARVRYTVINPLGVEPEPGTPTIIMCNHSSLYDIPLGYKAFPKHSMRMLAKKELSHIPIFGQGMKDAEFVFINRKNRNEAVRDLQVARELMESGIILWVSPEGTRSASGKLAPFKKGAFVLAINAKATIIPIGIRGAFNILPPKKIFAIHLNQEAEIHIGEPINAADYCLETKEELLELTWKRIRALTGEAEEPSQTAVEANERAVKSEIPTK